MKNYLNLPTKAIINKRLPKKTIFQNLNYTKVDKVLFDKVESIYIYAILAVDSIGIRGYKDDIVDYERIIVLDVKVNSNIGLNKLIDKLHNLFPNPIILNISNGDERIISTANKRININDKTKAVITAVNSFSFNDNGNYTNYYNLLDYKKQDNENLFKFYQTFTNNILIGNVYNIINDFTISIKYSEELIEDIDRYLDIEKMLEELDKQNYNMMRDKMNNHMKIMKLKQEQKKIKGKLEEKIYGKNE